MRHRQEQPVPGDVRPEVDRELRPASRVEARGARRLVVPARWTTVSTARCESGKRRQRGVGVVDVEPATQHRLDVEHEVARPLEHVLAQVAVERELELDDHLAMPPHGVLDQIGVRSGEGGGNAWRLATERSPTRHRRIRLPQDARTLRARWASAAQGDAPRKASQY